MWILLNICQTSLSAECCHLFLAILLLIGVLQIYSTHLVQVLCIGHDCYLTSFSLAPKETSDKPEDGKVTLSFFLSCLLSSSLSASEHILLLPFCLKALWQHQPKLSVLPSFMYMAHSARNSCTWRKMYWLVFWLPFCHLLYHIMQTEAIPVH